MSYQFIHITKTGGTAVEKFFNRHYPGDIAGEGHQALCVQYDHPIVIVREPFERFLSMFYYWRYGAE